MLLAIVVGIALGGLEVLLVFVIRGPYNRRVAWPVSLLGILSAILWVAAYVGVPFEIMKRRGRVVGIDFTILTLDFLGAFFSLLLVGMSASSVENSSHHIVCIYG